MSRARRPTGKPTPPGHALRDLDDELAFAGLHSARSHAVAPAAGGSGTLVARTLQELAHLVFHGPLQDEPSAEAAQKFTYGEVTHWLRPDGAGDIYWQGEVRRFYLEWDRGTVKLADTSEKLRGYALFFASTLRHAEGHRARGDLLVVTGSPLRERVIWRLLEESFAAIDMTPSACFTSIDSLVERFGPLGTQWRSFASRARARWGDLAEA